MSEEMSDELRAAVARGWRVLVKPSTFGERLDHGVTDPLVIVLHRGRHGWKAAGYGDVKLPHQIYLADLTPLCEFSHEIVVVGLRSGVWRTVWARSDRDVSHAALCAQSRPDAEPMFGTMIEADFEKGTATFEMRGDYAAAAGLYEIRPHQPIAAAQQEAASRLDREMIALALECVAGDNTVTFSGTELREQAALIRSSTAAGES